MANVAGRVLGTMIVYGYPKLSLDAELDLAEWIGAEVLEILPRWKELPDPRLLRQAVADRGLTIHSAHGCWGGESILAPRVDMGSTTQAVHEASVDDLRRCVDWLAEAGGTVLVVHPGGFSDRAEFDARRDALAQALSTLADHAEGTGIIVAVENMPPGVNPGSRMADLAELVQELNRNELGLTLDVAHAHIAADAASETLAAGRLLASTHVHDNDGRHDSHHPPGQGTIDWPSWFAALDAIGYTGPIVLECIKKIREDRSRYRREVLAPFLGPSSR
ncbi:sugar phosphate isomerase/epimerase family protein [Paludisphaera rhizosphaerae]|uniref:sugar phosphate isomerase/epimerase family protein n=1 Tax=Paludisphaera rhizosphaerae TaxID=2711216 RepID=UPI001F0F27E9|nr:sugar phosphate isomerase/epimerase family protein [Paludisphaera rhizosphaerae]